MNKCLLLLLSSGLAFLSACGHSGETTPASGVDDKSAQGVAPAIPPNLILTTDTLYQEDRNYSFVYSFSNSSPAPVSITEVKSGGAMAPGFSREPIPPGGCGWVSGTMDLTNRTGDFDKSLVILLATDKGNETYTIRFKGFISTGARPLTRTGDVFPASFLTEAGEFWEARIRLANEGSLPLVVREMAADEPGWDLSLITDTVCGIPMALHSLKPGKTGTLVARIAKSSLTGVEKGKLEMKVRMKANARIPVLRVRKMVQPA